MYTTLYCTNGGFKLLKSFSMVSLSHGFTLEAGNVLPKGFFTWKIISYSNLSVPLSPSLILSISCQAHYIHSFIEWYQHLTPQIILHSRWQSTTYDEHSNNFWPHSIARVVMTILFYFCFSMTQQVHYHEYPLDSWWIYPSVDVNFETCTPKSPTQQHCVLKVLDTYLKSLK